MCMCALKKNCFHFSECQTVIQFVKKKYFLLHYTGVGSATSKRLQSIGVVSVSDLQRCPPSQLEEEFGVAMATTIHQLSMGIDDSPVVTYSRPQVSGREKWWVGAYAF